MQVKYEASNIVRMTSSLRVTPRRGSSWHKDPQLFMSLNYLTCSCSGEVKMREGLLWLSKLIDEHLQV